jgi:hypothetical protein
MHAQPAQMTAPALQALLKDWALAGQWGLDSRRSSIGLRSKSIWGLVPVAVSAPHAAAAPVRAPGTDADRSRRDVGAGQGPRGRSAYVRAAA